MKDEHEVIVVINILDFLRATTPQKIKPPREHLTQVYGLTLVSPKQEVKIDLVLHISLSVTISTGTEQLHM